MNLQSYCQKIKAGWLINAFRMILMSVICLNFVSPANALPKDNACQNRHLKVAVISSGIQKNTTVYFSQILNRLGEEGYIAKTKIPRTIDFKNRSEYKLYVSDATKGKCLEFPEDYSFFLDWEVPVIKEKVEELSRASEKKEIDLILSLGDLSSEYLVEKNIDIPVVCIDTNSTEKLKELAKDKEKIIFLDDSRNIKDDIDLFYPMFGYTSLGFLRDKNHVFDLYSTYEDVLSYTEEKNMPMTVCEGSFFTPDKEVAHAEFSRCMTELSEKNVNVVFIPEVGNGIDMQFFYSQLRPLLAKKIAVISSDSKAQVEAGSLLSVYDQDESTRANYVADFIVELVTNGFDVKSALRKELVIPLYFGVNLKTAAIVQWRPAFEALVAVDDVFHTIRSQ